MKKTLLILIFVCIQMVIFSSLGSTVKADPLPPETDPTTPTQGIEDPDNPENEEGRGERTERSVLSPKSPLSQPNSETPIEGDSPNSSEPLNAPLSAVASSGESATVFSGPERITVHLRTHRKQKDLIIKTPFRNGRAGKLVSIKFRYNNILELTWENGLTRYLILRPERRNDLVQGWLDPNEEFLFTEAQKQKNTILIFNLITGEQFEKKFESFGFNEIVGLSPDGKFLLVSAKTEGVLYVISIQEEEFPVQVAKISKEEFLVLGKQRALKNFEILENRVRIKTLEGAVVTYRMMKELPAQSLKITG